MLKLWERILASEGRTFSIVEDLQRPHAENIEGFGLSVFVTDRFDEFSSAPGPYLAALYYERMLAGEEILLTREGLRAAMASTGLNIVVLHFGLANEDLSDPRTALVLTAGTAAFYFFHSGYRIALWPAPAGGGTSTGTAPAAGSGVSARFAPLAA